MNKITKENLPRFLDYYHHLHDSYITNINYDIKASKIELLIDVVWSGDPVLKKDETYETNPTKMRIELKNIETYNIKEIFSWDYIHNVFIQYIKFNNNEFICLADNKNDPLIYIVCHEMLFEEIKQ